MTFLRILSTLPYASENTGLRETRSVRSRLHVMLLRWCSVTSRVHFMMSVQPSANLGWALCRPCIKLLPSRGYYFAAFLHPPTQAHGNLHRKLAGHCFHITPSLHSHEHQHKPANYRKSQSPGYNTRKSRVANPDRSKPGQTSVIDRAPAKIFPPPHPAATRCPYEAPSRAHNAPEWYYTDHEHGFGSSKRSCTTHAPKRFRTETSCWLTGASV